MPAEHSIHMCSHIALGIRRTALPCQPSNSGVAGNTSMRRSSLIVCVLVCVIAPIAPSCAQVTSQLDAAAQQAARDGLFAGMIHVMRGDSVLFSKGFGDAVPELGVPMKNDHRYPIGSNTKLFTAVAVWQLHKAGKLNAYLPVTKYMNGSELGLKEPWCPRPHNSSAAGPCQVPNLQQLLRMSGGVLGFDNCAYPDDAWQQQYCFTGPKIGQGLNSLNTLLMGQMGAVSMAEYLKASGVFGMPLDFAPGTGYHYSNPGYTLVGYIVEKVSGIPLANYFQTHIFDKVGLSSTVYDVTNGALGLHKNVLPYPAYIAYLAPATKQIQATTGIDSLSNLVDSAGSISSWTFGDFNNRTLLSSQRQAVLSSDTESNGVYAFTARYPGPSNLDFTIGNAAGAMLSTPQDMAQWFRVLVTQPDQLGLSKEILRSLFGLTTVVPRVQTIGNVTWLYAQGILVVPDPDHPRGLGVSHLYYVGSLGGFRAVVYVALHPTNSFKDIFVNVLAATVLPDPATWPPGISFTSEGSCVYAAVNASTSSANSTSSPSQKAASSDATTSVGGRRGLLSPETANTAETGGVAARGAVSDILCEVKVLQPVAMRSLAEVLVFKAVKAVTGTKWFGLQ